MSRASSNKADQDLIKYINDFAYGTAIVRVDRINGKTIKITTTGEETLKYVDNTEARRDLDSMVLNLIDIGYTGEATVKLTMKDGQIDLISVFNKKETKY